MSIENAVVVDMDDQPLYWHEPEGRSSGHLPDSQDLWEVIWNNRDKVKGIAHSHPGGGVPGPSHTDVTTFSAIEIALGRRLSWWIISKEHLVELQHRGKDADRYEYIMTDSKPVKDGLIGGYTRQPSWLEKLWHISYAKPAPLWGGEVYDIRPFENAEPLPCGCGKNYGCYPPEAWAQDSHALIAQGERGAVVIESVGAHLDFEINESGLGPDAEDLGFVVSHDDPAIFIWTGKIKGSGEYDSYPDGVTRPLTEEELLKFARGEPVLPTDAIPPCHEVPCAKRRAMLAGPKKVADEEDVHEVRMIFEKEK